MAIREIDANLVIAEGELFFVTKDGQSHLKRDSFRAIPILNQEVYSASETGEPDDLYKRLYPIYRALLERGIVKMEGEGMPLSPGEMATITDIDLQKLETKTAFLWGVNWKFTGLVLDVHQGDKPRIRSVFEDDSPTNEPMKELKA